MLFKIYLQASTIPDFIKIRNSLKCYLLIYMVQRALQLKVKKLVSFKNCLTQNGKNKKLVNCSNNFCYLELKNIRLKS